jgi:hypothetical protein
MRLPSSAHTSQPWRIHDLTRDFRLEDVWQLPGFGSADGFPRVVARTASQDPARSGSWAVRTLFAARWRIGQLLGWDDPNSGLGQRVTTLRERLPEDLRRTHGPEFVALPFSSLYLLENEFAAEVANRTMHGVMHLGWVAQPSGRFAAQMAVLVRPNGLLGTTYMGAIRPFRHLVVYPGILREGNE